MAARRRSAPLQRKHLPESTGPALLAWFLTHARELPWRQTTDPYAVWISEVMLQQTQVRTVIPYWTRWMDALPTVQHLADAPIDQVLKLWEGLGYYSRARNLHAAAQQIVARHQAAFPRDPDAILALPGIGRYTLGAIGSIAFNLPLPLLDGNVIRVLTRLLALRGDPKERSLNDALWDLAGQLVQSVESSPWPPSTPGAAPMKLSGPCSALNQSLMELGALVCTPANPACSTCPLNHLCSAHRLGSPTAFPESAARAVITPRTLATVLWHHEGRWLLHRRPESTVNGGLWEFPNIECGDQTDPTAALARWLQIDRFELQPAGDLRHSITRFRFHQKLHRLAIAPRHPLPAGDFAWVTPAELDQLPLTAAHRRAARQLVPSPA